MILPDHSPDIVVTRPDDRRAMLLRAFEASWERNKAGYLYLARLAEEKKSRRANHSN